MIVEIYHISLKSNSVKSAILAEIWLWYIIDVEKSCDLNIVLNRVYCPVDVLVLPQAVEPFLFKLVHHGFLLARQVQHAEGKVPDQKQ